MVSALSSDSRAGPLLSICMAERAAPHPHTPTRPPAAEAAAGSDAVAASAPPPTFLSSNHSRPLSARELEPPIRTYSLGAHTNPLNGMIMIMKCLKGIVLLFPSTTKCYLLQHVKKQLLTLKNKNKNRGWMRCKNRQETKIQNSLQMLEYN